MSSEPVGFKQQLFAQFARVGQALGNGNRLELLEFLAQGERSVEALASAANLSVANTSQHLQVLRQAGLVASRKSGQRAIYSIAGIEVIELILALRRVAEAGLAEIDRLVESYLSVKDDLEPVAASDVLDRVRDGLVTLVDVRPAEEFEAGHIPGAINVPLAELDRTLDQFAESTEIVAYCRGPFCILAYEAVSKLREKGRRARRLAVGYPEWRLASENTA